MGIDLAVVLSHSLEAADLVAFPERVLSSIRMRHAAEQLWQVMQPRWPDLGTVTEFLSFQSEQQVSVSDVSTAWNRVDGDIPSFWWAGFHVCFGRHGVAAIHIEKLVGFVLDIDGLRNPLRSCAQALAHELRSSRIVYGPDAFSPFQHAISVCLEDGGSLTDALWDAERRCGVPVSTIREMADEAEELNLDSKCYCVETVDREEQLH
jgi:hypothetical protein